MGLGNAVKEILNMGNSSSDADRQDGGAPEIVRGSVGKVRSASDNASGTGATGHSSQQTTTTTTSHSSSDKAGQVEPTCASCDDKWAKEGKAVVWEDAQGKMGQAHEQARIAEKNACMATKALESISELQRVSETSRTRLHELERELTTMRSNGVDLRAKQAEVDAAKRRAEEAHEALIAAQKRAKEHEGVISEKDRQARAAQGKLQEDERKVGPLEEELNNVRRARTEVEERYNKEQTEWRELEGIYNTKESEFKHLQHEETTHKRAVEEAEAALAAAKERYQHFHGNFQNFKNKHSSLVTRRDELNSQTASTKKYLEEVREHEMDLQRRLEELKGLQHQHHGAARTAADAAQAERQRHQEHVSTLQGIEQRITTHMTSTQKAEESLSQAEQQARAERERQAALSRELEQTKSTTTTTSTNAAEKLEEYEALKARAVEANARKEELFDEAKRLGAVGDRNADAHLRDMEARVKNVDISSIKSKSGTTTTTTTTRSTLTNEE